MRRSVLTAPVLLLLLRAVPGAGAGTADDLLPDLDPAVPQGVRLLTVGAGGGLRDWLVFGSALDNVGKGPLIIHARRPNRATVRMAVTQQLVARDGSSRSVRSAAVVRYVHEKTHQHWHLLKIVRYELHRPGAGEPLVRDRKTGFCLGDRYDTNANRTLPGEPAQAVYWRECGRGQPGLLGVTEGISIGYGDDYAPLLEGQYLDVTAIPDGRYVLVHRADEERWLVEARYDNNASSVLLRLAHDGRGARTVRVLARCPQTDTCPAGNP